MNKHHSKIIVVFGVFIGFFALIVFGSLFFVKCGAGWMAISQYSPYAYLCVDSEVRNFPMYGIVNTPLFGSQTEIVDGTSHEPPSNDLVFKKQHRNTNFLK